MSKIIEQAKNASEALTGEKKRITNDLNEIFSEVNKQQEGVIIEIPWKANYENEYVETTTVVLMKTDDKRAYFINPMKVSNQPVEIKEEDKKGGPRIVHNDGYESILIQDLQKMSKESEVLGLVNI